MSTVSRTGLLHQLARLYGVQTVYFDVEHHRRQASAEALLAVLRALGAPVTTFEDIPSACREQLQAQWQQPLEPVAVSWDGRPPRLKVRLPHDAADARLAVHLRLETGEQRSWEWHGAELPALETVEIGEKRYVVKRLPLLPGDLPWGYHRLTLEVPGGLAEALMVAAPRKAYTPPDGAAGRPWGVFLPLYSLNTRRSWGSGDFSDLEALVEWTSGMGGSLVATLPLLAAFLDEPLSPSPYAPASRLMWNEFYVDVTRAPELQRCPKARALLESTSFQQETEALRHLPLVDYRRQMALKRRILEELSRCCFDSPDRLEALTQFVETHPMVEDYARFRAACQRQRTPWRAWRSPLREGALGEGDYDEEARRYYLYAQWLAHEQVHVLSQKARQQGVRLYFDLPLGVHPDGYDIWRERDVFVSGVSAGAPPDAFFTKGQNWALPPLHPQQLREQGYRYYIACLRHQLQEAGILRIDHVMGFHRLFWVPQGLEAAEGVYVRYRPEEFYALLTLESHRNRAIIVGEDLGTVPPQVRPAMSRHGLHRSYVVQYELTPDPQNALPAPSAGVTASLNTHDMPTFAALWQGLDIQERSQMGLLDEISAQQELNRRQSLKEALAGFLHQRGWLHKPTLEAGAVLKACLEFLSASPAPVVLVNLEDLWLETQPQNVPGTGDERPNWRRKARHTFEEFSRLPEVGDALREADRLRKGISKGLCPLDGGLGVPPSFTYRGVVETKGFAEQLNAEKGRDTMKAQDARTQIQPARYDIALLTDQDLYLFNEGSHYRLYQKLGARPLTVDGSRGTYFAVWAPNADQVSVVGDFNGWDRTSHPLRVREQSGIWEGFIPGVVEGVRYKYHIVSRYQGYQVDKADPFAFYGEVPPRTASVVWNLDYPWGDEKWMLKRHQHNALSAPIAIYEVHLGSWKRAPEEGHRPLTYRELAPLLAEYIEHMGFTHVEFLPPMEHPFYGSWGYQICGYFAPSSRYGTPQDLMYLIDYLHQRGIGVIVDWVPSHFPTDEHGLGFFDGTHLYEHADPRKGFHPDWSSFIFNYGRNEVRSFLLSTAFFWLDKYHVDGLRVDAVASMLYLDYSRKEGEWIPNQYGSRENLEAISFLRRFNEEVYRNYPGVQTIAEESTAWAMVSRPNYVGGLGFGMKWDMGWMHDILEYMAREPVHRKYHHSNLTFRMLYAFSENFVLSLSHDEVVHGKGSLLGKMPGDDWQKFANLRLLLAYMYSQPGKKLLFMGGEFGQLSEWAHDQSLDWHLLQDRPHAGLQRWVADLNRLYRAEPALHELDFDWAGFEWVDCNDIENSIISFIRKGRSTGDIILVVCNFTPAHRLNYRVGVPRGGMWREVLNSDGREYGGSGQGNMGRVEAAPIPHHGRSHSLDLTLPPLSALLFKSVGEYP